MQPLKLHLTGLVPWRKESCDCWFLAATDYLLETVGSNRLPAPACIHALCHLLEALHSTKASCYSAFEGVALVQLRVLIPGRCR